MIIPTKHHSFHINISPPSDIWPNGFFYLYRINGDQIAERTKFDDKGNVVERHGWNGFDVGGFGSLDELAAKLAEIID